MRTSSRAARVLDTSALLALRGNERGADHVEQLLEAAKRGRGRLVLSFMTRMELLYTIERAEGETAARDALRLVDSFPIEWVSCEPGILQTAATLKARGGLSVADSWIAATAVAYDAILVHRDPEFASLREIPQESLDSR
ncbi:MAG: PIN domain-containing protein [Gammaproteobacteria bacterium]